MTHIDDIWARVWAAKPGKKAAAMAPNPDTGETKVKYVASSLAHGEEVPLWVVVEAGAWDEASAPYYELYAVTGDGTYAKAHAELFAHARDDLLYLFDLMERAVVMVQRVVDGIRVDDTHEEQQWLRDAERGE